MSLNRETKSNNFQTNTLGKGMKYLIPPAIDSIVLVLFFYKNGFGIK